MCCSGPNPPKTERSRPNPTQPNPWVNPTHGQLCDTLTEQHAETLRQGDDGQSSARRRAVLVDELDIQNAERLGCTADHQEVHDETTCSHPHIKHQHHHAITHVDYHRPTDTPYTFPLKKCPSMVIHRAFISFTVPWPI